MEGRIQDLEATVGFLMEVLRSHNMLPNCPTEPVQCVGLQTPPRAPEKPVVVPEGPMQKRREEALAMALARRKAAEQKATNNVQRNIMESIAEEVVVPTRECDNGDEAKKVYKKIPGKYCSARIEGVMVEIPGTKSSRSGKCVQAYKSKECERAACVSVKTGDDEDDVCYLCSVCHSRYNEKKDTWLGFFDDGMIPPRSHLMGSEWYKKMVAVGIAKMGGKVEENGNGSDSDCDSDWVEEVGKCIGTDKCCCDTCYGKVRDDARPYIAKANAGK